MLLVTLYSVLYSLLFFHVLYTSPLAERQRFTRLIAWHVTNSTNTIHYNMYEIRRRNRLARNIQVFEEASSTAIRDDGHLFVVYDHTTSLFRLVSRSFESLSSLEYPVSRASVNASAGDILIRTAQDSPPPPRYLRSRGCARRRGRSRSLRLR